jgi:hypothetical protein
MENTTMHANNFLRFLALGLVLGLALPAASAPEEVTSVKRFAIFSGANYGGLDRARLRFAESDAQGIALLMTELGGVAQIDHLLIQDPDPKKLRIAFARMAVRIMTAKTANTRVEFIFYYSGRSDETGLMLSGKLMNYKEVRGLLKSLRADVCVAILDSCASGAFTRAKGGIHRKPFLIDDSSKVRGYAVLTSASATEAAQESDLVDGSFFTHFLSAGLRGAADANQDGKVTLGEAYQYAFNETLARTELTHIGPQHPNYEFQLSGSGDLTLTDLRDVSAMLNLGPEIKGRLFVRDTQGNLFVEVNKPLNQPMNLGLPPGTYHITLNTQEGKHRGTIKIITGKPTPLNVALLEVVAKESSVARGDNHRVGEPSEFATYWFSLSLAPGVDTNTGSALPILNQLAFNIFGEGDALNGAEFSALGSIRKYHVTGAQFTGGFNMAQSVYGVQLATMNYTWDDMRGVQFGVANYVTDMSGAVPSWA